ncbi:MAG: DUF6508 domain-containing protein [Flavisolibacter sp.]
MIELNQLHTHLSKLKPHDYIDLFALVPAIETKTSFGKIVGGEKNMDGSYNGFGWVADDIVIDFLRIIYDMDLVPVFNWPSWNKEYAAVLAQLKKNPQEIDTITICKCFTCMVRADRFCDGYLIEVFENGTVLSLLKCLQERVTKGV